LPAWRTRKDKRKYQKRDRIQSRKDPKLENYIRKELLKKKRPTKVLPVTHGHGRSYVGKESFSKEDIDQVIEFNRCLVTKRGEGFEVDADVLHRIFKRVNNSFVDVRDRRERIVRKAAILMSGITFNQPFFEGNKETALSLTIDFLNQNGLDLPIKSKEQAKELYDILVKTAFKFAGDKTIQSEVEEFLMKKVVTFVP